MRTFCARGLLWVEKIWYSYEDSEWNASTAQYEFNVTAPGVHKLEFYAVDKAENVEDVSTEFIKIDKDNPYSTFHQEGVVGAPEWYRSNVNITIEGYDNTSGVYSVMYRVGSSREFKNYTQPIVLTQDGVYEIQYYAVDLAGREEPIQTQSVGIDRTPPKSTSTVRGELGANGWYTTQSGVELTAVDNVSGIKEIRYKINGNGWVKYAPNSTSENSVTAVLPLSNGVHNLSYYSVNCADLTEGKKTVRIKIDTQPPTKPTLSVSVPRFINTSSLSLAWSSSHDNLSGNVTYILLCSQNANFSPATVAQQLTTTHCDLPLTEGVKTYFKICARDDAGNKAESEVYNTTSDTSPPETYASVVGQMYLGAYVSPVAVELYTLSDTSGVVKTRYSLGTGWVDYEKPLKFSENGSYVIKYYSIDGAGNRETTKTTNFVIDIPVADPDVDVDEPENATVQDNFTLTWTMESPVGDALYVWIIALEADTGFRIVLAKGLKNITSYTVDTTHLPNARYYVNLIVKDEHRRTVNITTLTTFLVNNPYITQLSAGGYPLEEHTTTALEHEGEKVKLSANLTSRKFSKTTFTLHFYLDDELAGTSELTLDSLEKGSAHTFKTLTGGKHTLLVKLYDQNTKLLETQSASFTLQTEGKKMSTGYKLTPPLLLVLAGVIFAGLIASLFFIRRKRKFGKMYEGEEGEEGEEE